MATMGKYCKAYLIRSLREFNGWTENDKNLRKERKIVAGEEIEAERVLTDEDHLYLHENYVVTDGIFKDENIIFDNITPEWKQYCQEVLNFEIPRYESGKPIEQEAETT